MKIIILIPVYNDWQSVFKLLENIDVQIKDWDAEVSVLIVNDASKEEIPIVRRQRIILVRHGMTSFTQAHDSLGAKLLTSKSVRILLLGP